MVRIAGRVASLELAGRSDKILLGVCFMCLEGLGLFQRCLPRLEDTAAVARVEPKSDGCHVEETVATLRWELASAGEYDFPLRKIT